MLFSCGIAWIRVERRYRSIEHHLGLYLGSQTVLSRLVQLLEKRRRLSDRRPPHNQALKGLCTPFLPFELLRSYLAQLLNLKWNHARASCNLRALQMTYDPSDFTSHEWLISWTTMTTILCSWEKHCMIGQLCCLLPVSSHWATFLDLFYLYEPSTPYSPSSGGPGRALPHSSTTRKARESARRSFKPAVL